MFASLKAIPAALTAGLIALAIGARIYYDHDAGGFAAAAPAPVRVLHIIDGDTLTLSRDGRPIRARLTAVDAPELAQPSGPAARAGLQQFCAAAAIYWRCIDSDRYDRQIGDLTTPDGRRASVELARAGLAWHYAHFAPRDFQVRDAAECAKMAHIGLWADANPIAPWDYRHQRTAH